MIGARAFPLWGLRYAECGVDSSAGTQIDPGIDRVVLSQQAVVAWLDGFGSGVATFTGWAAQRLRHGREGESETASGRIRLEE